MQLAPMFTPTAFPGIATQDYANYTPTDHQVWQVLYERMELLLPGKAATSFLACLQEVGFVPDKIPDFEQVSRLLGAKTGWRLQPVTGLIDDAPFFELLANRIFPAGNWIRTPEQLDYLEQPDLFHDIFGHVPLLAEPSFAAFLEGLGQIGHAYTHEPILIELLARLYWFTVEFGLIRERAGLRIYGAGILSSTGETSYCLGVLPARRRFSVCDVLATEFQKDSYQTQYFIIESYDELFAALPEVEVLLARAAALAKTLGPVPEEEIPHTATRCILDCLG